MSKASLTVSPDTIAPFVHWIRHEKVLLDSDLAGLYGVETKVLNQAVKRNLERFPEDFMFQLTAEEVDASRCQTGILKDAAGSALKCQIGISKPTPPEDGVTLRSQIVTSKEPDSASRSQIVTLKRGQNIKYLPYAFTEQGVAMLSSVLRSRRAVEVNIAIMRTFVQLRRLMDSNRDLAKKIEAIESKYDQQFAVVFDAIKQLIAEDTARKAQPKRRIGFQP